EPALVLAGSLTPMNPTGSLKPCHRLGLNMTPFSTMGVRMPQISSLLGQITVPSEARLTYLIATMALASPSLTTSGEVLPWPPFCQSSGLLRHNSWPVLASKARSVLLAPKISFQSTRFGEMWFPCSRDPSDASCLLHTRLPSRLKQAMTCAPGPFIPPPQAQ